jgi:acetyltransferase-like isoleucine patch superfamily enzyme
MKKYINFLMKLNLKTIYFNFRYLPLNKAIKFPFLISNKVYLRKTQGKLIFECPILPGMVKIGFEKVGIFDEKVSRSIWEVGGTIIFKGNANFGHGSKIVVGDEGILILGNKFTVTAETSIIAFSKVQFGNDCLLSWDILIMDTDFHKIIDENGNLINNPKPIILGNRVWIGCRCLILKGTFIPNNSIIGANSIVNKVLVGENCIFAGNPIKCIKEKVTWEP